MFCLMVIIILFFKNSLNDNNNNFLLTYTSDILPPISLRDHFIIVARYFYPRKNWKTSHLGDLIFKNYNYDTFMKKNKTFEILVWRHWEWLKNRHVHFFGLNNDSQDIFTGCSVSNCIFTGNDNSLDTVDIVVVHVMNGIFPVVKKRSNKQIWVFLNDESPFNAFHQAKSKVMIKKLANIFNWSMTYRSDAEVPVPYGRTLPLQRPKTYKITYQTIAKLIPYLEGKRSDVLVAVLMSHCSVSFRMYFLNELEKFIKIDVFGKCSKDHKKRYKCPGHFKADCPLINNYYFYLVMENSICRQYITEKVFHHAYSKGAIPIMVGPFINDSRMLLPPNSYIHYRYFKSPRELAAKIMSTFRNNTEFFSYHLWRNHFEVVNEHGYFQTKSYHLCRLCEAVNYNEEKLNTYTFEDLQLFLDPKLSCKKNLYEKEISDHPWASVQSKSIKFKFPSKQD